MDARHKAGHDDWGCGNRTRQALSSLRFGLFENFKGATSLLLWGDNDGLAKLHRLLRDLAGGRTQTVQLERLRWAESVTGARVRFGVAEEGQEIAKASRIGDGAGVEWRASVERLAEAADLVAALMDPTCEAGHQYLPTPARDLLQVIVSKGEYGPDFGRREQAGPQGG